MTRPVLRPSTVLFVWELGENFGHVMPLLALAQRLRARGHRAVFALRDLHRAGPVRAAGFTVMQAPSHPDRWFKKDDPQPANFAEVLAIFGFADATVLDNYVAAWQALYALLRPGLVVTSHAPTALLAARMAGIPVAVMALPFELPPAVSPPPALRPWEEVPVQRHRRAEAAVVRAINRVARRRFAIDAMHQLYDTGHVYLNTFTELEAYEERPGAAYGGALFEREAGVDADWPEGEGKRIYAYLQPAMPGFADVLRQLRQSPWRILLAAPGVKTPAQLQGNLRITGELVSLAKVLPRCDAVLSYSGHGMAAAALLAGKPLAMLHGNLEQLLTARRVVHMGGGVMPDAEGRGSIDSLIERALKPAAGQAARRFADKYRAYDPRRRIGEIALELGVLL